MQWFISVGTRRTLGAWLFVACLAVIGWPSQAAAASGVRPLDPAAVAALERLPGRRSVAVHPLTGAVRFARFRDGGPSDFRTRAGRDARAAAGDFLAAHHAAFGLTDPGAELSEPRVVTDVHSHRHVRYRQRHRGVPVFGSRLRVHFDARGDLSAVSSSILPGIAVDPIPRRSASEAREVAVAWIRRLRSAQSGVASLAAKSAELMFFRAGLVQGVAGSDHLTWAVEVANRGPTIRELVFVDAHSGAVVEHYGRIAHALDRRVSESSFANVVWTEGDPDPIPALWAGGGAQQVADWQNEIDGSAETYHLFANLTGNAWLSYDGSDAPMRTINNDPAINCPNANWNGVTTNYCSDVTGDDTVAHEWGHAYSEYTHDLIYAWQPGALNEAYSDIWGEVVDLLNGRGTDAPGGLRSGGSCSTRGLGNPAVDDSYRWLAGEDSPAFGVSIRDMWHPNCFNDPGKVSDAQYHCSSSDSGGVHVNSGVPNHAFALLVDGGSYNGEVVQGIGLTKAAHLYWYAQAQFQTPTSGFTHHADALEAACSALIGLPLNALDTSQVNPVVSGEVISAADCDQVAAAIAAVELRQPPVQCGFASLLVSPAPPLCDGLGAVEPIASNDWESGFAGWTPGERAVADPADFAAVGSWQIAGSLPEGRTGSAAFGPDPVIGDCAGDDISGVLTLESPDIVVPVDAGVPRVAFDHRLATEAGWDGGNLKWSVNGGPFALVPPERLVFNSYNAVLQDAASGNTNPMQNEPAFTGADGGSVGSAWGQTQVNLAGLAAAGDTLRLRFELGLDGCNGLDGWYVDDVQVYACADEVAPICGDGVTDLGQGCDDGNSVSGDGCSSACLVEAGYTCVTQTQPSTCLWAGPLLELSPAGLTAVLEPGGNAGLPLAVANRGATALHWHLSEGGATPSVDASLAPVVGAAPLGPVSLSHSLSTAIVSGNSVACLNGSNHVDNSYLRVFDLDAFGVGAPFALSSVEIGIESASSGSGSQPVSVRIHRLDGDLELANLTLLGSNTILQPDVSGASVEIPVAASLAAGSRLVVEIFTPSGIADDARLFVGSNSSGQTGPTYLLAPSCDILEPTETAAIGFANMHMVMTVHGTLASACDPLAAIPWASVAPASGTLATGVSETVTVTLDATGLADDVYDATLCVDSNDATAPLLALPLQLVVGNDPDGDGVATADENAGPNGGDGNADGLPDAGQAGVATLPIAGSYVTLASDRGCRLRVDFASASELPPDPGFVRPYGTIGFRLDDCDFTPQQAYVTISYHESANPSAAELAAGVYRNAVPGNVVGWSPSGWFTFAFAETLVIDPDAGGPLPPVLSVRMPLVDGRLGDAVFGSVDGEIVHIGAFALPESFFAATAIPALSRAGIWLLMALVLLAARRVRFRPRSPPRRA